jgi:alpha-tubulin suppressor-like RCC1 family protein
VPIEFRNLLAPLGLALATFSCGPTESRTFGPSDAVIATPFKYFSISAGFQHGCVVRTINLIRAGTLCWGSNNAGQLGIGSAATQVSTPTMVQPDPELGQVDAGDSHTCGVSRNVFSTSGTLIGLVYCWGRNVEGQLGDNTNTNRSTPIQIAGGIGFQTVSSGGNHTCGVNGGNLVYCWGSGAFGQLGNNSAINRKVATQISGSRLYTSVSAGFRHTCGLTNGFVYCWGINNRYQLGDGTQVQRNSPVPLPGSHKWKAVSAGGEHTCAIAVGEPAAGITDGAMYCWGRNSAGQLGNNTLADQPFAHLVSGGLTWQSLAAGDNNTCGITTGSALYCWGGNSSGQVGDGTTILRAVPRLVSGGINPSFVSAGNAFMLAVKFTALYSWGSNAQGQLGTGGTTGSSTPVLFLGCTGC